jgi:hypothetical protein
MRLSPAHFDEINTVVLRRNERSEPEIDVEQVSKQMEFVKQLYDAKSGSFTTSEGGR